MEAGEPQQFRVWGLGFKLGGSHHPGLGVVGGGVAVVSDVEFGALEEFQEKARELRLLGLKFLGSWVPILVWVW